MKIICTNLIPAAIHQILLRKSDEVPILEEVGSFQSASGAKTPARSTNSLKILGLPYVLTWWFVASLRAAINPWSFRSNLENLRFAVEVESFQLEAVFAKTIQPLTH